MGDLPLRTFHEFSGALFRREAGWDVPIGYGALDAEVGHVRRSAGMIDLSDHGKVAVRGDDRVKFLDGLLTADIKILRPGTSTHALVLNEMSHVLGDMRVVSLEGALVLDIEASQKDTLLEYFRRQVVSDDVRFEDLGSCGHVEVHGPLAADMASAVIGVDVRGLSADELATFAVDRHQTGYVTRLDTLGESGFAIWAVGNSLATIWASLLRVGTPPLGRDAYEVLRIEAGRPCSGVDMTEDTLALEVAPPESISFTKGCYRGQEVVARGAYAGRMNRRLLGLRIDGDVPPSRGDTVRVEGEDAGFVTSGCWSPTTGWIVALALLQVERVRIDSRLFIDRSGWDLRASLHSLPFVLSRA